MNKENKEPNYEINETSDSNEKVPVLSYLRKKGFYIAIVVFTLAAAAISYTAVSGMLDKLIPNTKPPEETPQHSTILPPDEQTSEEIIVPIEPKVEPTVEPTYLEPAATIVEDLPLAVSYIEPIAAIMSQGFSGDTLVKSMTLKDWRTHNGVDYHAVEGTEVVAISSGEIAFADYDDLWGYVVEIKLDSGYTAVYKNLANINDLRAGERISQGDIVGTIGTSSVIEKGEGPHLHFELKSGDKYIDPISVIKS